ncbi:unnamed protein product [Pedinophyceae sp. YPF-701]|nr:unnamed protein product [Pedinophyceae sp. YPF-701]
MLFIPWRERPEKRTGLAPSLQVVDMVIYGTRGTDETLEVLASLTDEQAREVVEAVCVVLEDGDSDRRRLEYLLGTLGSDVVSRDDASEADDLGSAQSGHPLWGWLLGVDKEVASRMLSALIKLVRETDASSVFFRAESALAAATDASHLDGLHEALLERTTELYDAVAHRMLDKHAFSDSFMSRGRRIPQEAIEMAAAVADLEEDLSMPDDGDDPARAAPPGASGEDAVSMSESSSSEDEGQSQAVVKRLMQYVRRAHPASAMLLYPGYSPGTAVFSMERALSLQLREDEEYEWDHPRVDALIGKLISCLHGSHNTSTHVAGNASCALTVIGRAEGGMARIVTHKRAGRLGKYLARLLRLPGTAMAESHTIQIAIKQLSGMVESDEGAPWVLGLPERTRDSLLGRILELMEHEDLTLCTEATHTLSQLLLYTFPDTEDGVEQRRMVYTLPQAQHLPAMLARIMERGCGERSDRPRDGPRRQSEAEKYAGWYAAAEEACVIVTELILDDDGARLLRRGVQPKRAGGAEASGGDGDESASEDDTAAATALVEAAFGLLVSRDIDCVAAGSNVLQRLVEQGRPWRRLLGPTEERIMRLYATTETQGAHRWGLPVINRMLSVRGWLKAWLSHPSFPVFAAWLIAELDFREDSDAALAQESSEATSPPETGEAALMDLPTSEAMITNLLRMLRNKHTRSAGAAALGALQKHSQGVRDRLVQALRGRRDGCCLALLESAGLAPALLTAQLRSLDVPEKRQWIATQLQQELRAFGAPPLDAQSEDDEGAAEEDRDGAGSTSGGSDADDAGGAPPASRRRRRSQAVEIECERGSLVRDLCRGVAEARGIGTDLSKGISVRFKGESGQGAAVLREWFALVSQALSDSSFNMLVSRNGGQSYGPSPTAAMMGAEGAGSESEDARAYFETVGRVIGLGLYHNVPLDVSLSHSVLRFLQGGEPCAQDLAADDPDSHRYTVAFLEENAIDDLCLGLTFSAAVDPAGVLRGEVALAGRCPDDEVTDANKAEFAAALVRWRQRDAVLPHLEAIRRGVAAVAPLRIIERSGDFMSPGELSCVLSGVRSIDVSDWRQHSKVEGQYLTSEEGKHIVEWFWEIVDDFSQETRRNLLQFATASPNVPVGGFSQLQSAHGTHHPFTLSELSGRRGTDSLPRAGACFNTLFLPRFSSKAEMKEKLQIAIGMGKGHIDEDAMVIGSSADPSRARDGDDRPQETPSEPSDQGSPAA